MSGAYEEAQRIAHVGHWDWDILNGSLAWSDEVYRIFGFEPQVFGATYEAFLESVHPEDRRLVEEGVRLHLEEDVPYSVEHRVVRPDGEIRYVHEKGRVERAPDGSPTRMLGTVHDITRLTRVRQEQEALQEKFQEARRLESIGIVVGGIAHDFNNLLTPILGRISLIQRRLPEDEEVCNHLSSIERSAVRAAELIRQLVSYAGRVQLHTQPLDLYRHLHGIVQTAQSALVENISVSLSALDEELIIDADADQLERALSALLANSVEAIDGHDGAIAVKMDKVWLDPALIPNVRGAKGAAAGTYAMVEVRDDGSGMSEQIRDAAFEPFVTTREEGRGLGLPALVGIMKAHQGLATLESTPGEGTTVRLYFPLEK
ncbi:MAG: PAS domain-containing protein [Chrysiogenetes bacterium]|nr:PAS domain-containing protein [Chrysiogenetes bacterium]